MHHATAKTWAIHRFLLACAVVLAFTGGAAQAQSSPQQTGTAQPMELLLADNIRQSDLAAHVEIVKVTVASRAGNRTRYRMDAWVLERFKGPEIKEFAFVQEIEEATEGQAAAAEGIAGSRLIVALDKADNEDSYYLPKGRFSFPDHNVLIAAARKAARQ